MKERGPGDDDDDDWFWCLLHVIMLVLGHIRDQGHGRGRIVVEDHPEADPGVAADMREAAVGRATGTTKKIIPRLVAAAAGQSQIVESVMKTMTRITVEEARVRIGRRVVVVVRAEADLLLIRMHWLKW